MKKIFLTTVAVFGIITLTCYLISKPHPQIPQKYTLEILVYDSVGNEYHNVKTFDHIPTSKDTLDFYRKAK
jgi:hypothetical protein